MKEFTVVLCKRILAVNTVDAKVEYTLDNDLVSVILTPWHLDKHEVANLEEVKNLKDNPPCEETLLVEIKNITYQAGSDGYSADSIDNEMVYITNNIGDLIDKNLIQVISTDACIIEGQANLTVIDPE